MRGQISSVGRCKKLSVLFYAYNGLLVSPRPARFQEALYIMTGLFNRVNLSTNMEKTVGIVCQPCRSVNIHMMDSYMRHMTV